MSDTRAEDLAFAKERAMEYIDQGDVVQALSSFASDARKWGLLSEGALLLLDTEGIRCAMAGDITGMRRLIEGFA